MKTVKDIKEQIEGDIRTAFWGEDDDKNRAKLPLLLQILSTVFSYLFFSLHRKLDHLVDNLFLQNVKDEKMIKNFLEQYDIPLKRGEKAKGEIYVKTANKTSLKANTEFSYNAASDKFTTESSGRLFTFLTTTDTSLKPNVQNIVEVEASDIGDDYNLLKGATLTLTNSEGSIESDAEVVSDFKGGSENESILDAKGRLLNHIRTSTIRTGGTIEDYKLWASEVPPVHRTFVYPNDPYPGQVTIHFITNAAQSYIPGSENIKKVKEHILKSSPAGVEVFVDKPEDYQITVNISRVIYKDGVTKSAAEAVIKDRLKKFLLEKAEPGEHPNHSKFLEAILDTSVMKGYGPVTITAKFKGKDLTEKKQDGSLDIPPKAIGVLDIVELES